MARMTISTASAVTSIKSERHPTDSTSKPERADSRGKADNQGHNAHGAAALFAGEYQKNHGEYHRHNYAGGCCLENTAQQQDAEEGRKRRHKGAQGEYRNACDEKLSGGEAANKEGGKRDDNGFDQRIS